MDKYCDIVPHAGGWTYVLNGVEADCSFHTYELAVEAAKAEVAQGMRKKVFRFQGLNGEMLPVSSGAFLQGTYLT